MVLVGVWVGVQLPARKTQHPTRRCQTLPTPPLPNPTQAPATVASTLRPAPACSTSSLQPSLSPTATPPTSPTTRTLGSPICGASIVMILTSPTVPLAASTQA